MALIWHHLQPSVEDDDLTSPKLHFLPLSFIYQISKCWEPHQALLTKWRHGPNSLSLSHRHGPGMKELGLVILICFFLSSAELTEKSIKVPIVLERNMRRHKAFCSCAQRIIHKVNHFDICSRIFTKECSRMSTQAAA